MKKILSIMVIFTIFLFGNTLSEIENSGEIRIGVWFDQPPFSLYQDGKFEGFEVDMAHSIGKHIVGENGKVKLVGIKSVSHRMEILKNNEVDLVIASFTQTKDREKVIDFSMPYFAVAQGILTRSDDASINSIGDLRGKVASVQTGAVFAYEFVNKNSINVVEVDEVSEQYDLLKDKKVDMMINDNLIVMPFPILDKDVEVKSRFRNVGTSSYLAIGIQKNNNELREKVNEGLIKLSKDGFFKDTFENTFAVFYKGELEAKYFLLEDIYRIFG